MTGLRPDPVIRSAVMILEHGLLVVAADGGGASIYRNTSQDGLAKLELVEIHDAKSSSFSRTQEGDGATQYAPPTGGKIALAGHDYHEQGERQFATRLATRLDELVGRDEPAKMILFAAPRFLGVIRGEYSARLKTAIGAEISKDLREAPIKQIETALAALKHG